MFNELKAIFLQIKWHFVCTFSSFHCFKHHPHSKQSLTDCTNSQSWMWKLVTYRFPYQWNCRGGERKMDGTKEKGQNVKEKCSWMWIS